MIEARENDLPLLSAAGRTAVTAAAEAMATRVEEVREVIDSRILERIASIAEAPIELREDLEASTRAHMMLMAGMLGAWVYPKDVRPPPETTQWARDFVRLGLPVADLLRAYRVGHAALWAWWQALLREHAGNVEVLAEITAATSAFVFEYVDEVLQPVIGSYIAEQAAAEARLETLRAAEVRAIVADAAPRDPDAAGARLGYELGRWHVGFVAAAPEGAAPEAAYALLDTVGDRLAAALRLSEHPLVVPAAGTVVHGWLASAVKPMTTRDDLRIPGVVLAIGEPGRGLAGFRRSHTQALQAHRVARLGRRAPGSVLLYRDNAVLALLTTDAEEATRFAIDTLGDLAADNDAARRVLATLEIFQEEQLSVIRTARRLGLHQNTITYRVKKALDLAGHTEPGDVNLRTAVALHTLLRDSRPLGS